MDNPAGGRLVAGCEGLSRVAVAWEQGAPEVRGSSWGALSEVLSSWVSGLPEGYSGVLFIVGEWGTGKSMASSILRRAAEARGVGFREVTAPVLKRSRGPVELLKRLAGGSRGPLVAFIDQVEDLALSGGSVWQLLEAIGALLDPRDPRGEGFRGRLHVALALTPAALDRLRSELAARERLGWLLRRVTVVELAPLSKVELLNLASQAARAAGLGGLSGVLARPESASAIYWSSAGNPGVALKLLRDLGPGPCPLGALDLLERLSRVVIPSRYGVAVAGFDPAALERLKSAGRRCNAEDLAVLAAGGFARPDPGLAECAERAGVRVVEATLYRSLDPPVFAEEAARAVCSSSFECRRRTAAAALELVHPTRNGWAAAIPDRGWRGIPREALEAAARVAGGEPSGRVLLASLESLEGLYPRMASPPVPFIRDPGVAAAVYAEVSKSISRGGFAGLASQGFARLLKASGLAAGGRLKLRWAGGTYLAPFKVVVASGGVDASRYCGEPRVVVVVAPEDWEGEPAGGECPNVAVVKAPFGVLRLLGVAGYLSSSNTPGVDWDSLDSHLASTARELGVREALDALASRLGRSGVLVPPNPPASILSPASAYPAVMLALLSESLGGADALAEVAGRVEGALASGCSGRAGRWAPIEWASKIAPNSGGAEGVAEAARLAVEALSLEGLLSGGSLRLDSNPVASRVARGAGWFILPEESRAEAARALQVYKAIAGIELKSRPPAEVGARILRAVESLEATAETVARELGLAGAPPGLLAHVVSPEGRPLPASAYSVLVEWVKSKASTWNRAVAEALESLEEAAYSILKGAESALLAGVRSLKSFRPAGLEAEVEALRALSEAAKERARGLYGLFEKAYEYYKREAESLKWPRLAEDARARVSAVLEALRSGSVPEDVLAWMSRADCGLHGGNAVAAALAMTLEEARRRAASLTRSARRVKSELARVAALYSKLEGEGLARVLEGLRPPGIDWSTGPSGVLHAVQAVRVELESLAANSKLLARLGEEAERKASEARTLASRVEETAKDLEGHARSVLEALSQAGGPLPPGVSGAAERLESAAREALEASSEARVEVERLRGEAGDLLDMVASARSSALVDIAERAVLRLGGVVESLKRLEAKLARLKAALAEEEQGLAAAVVSEALAVAERARILQEVLGPGATAALSGAELSARAAAARAREGRLLDALRDLSEALRRLEEPLAGQAPGLGKVELIVYTIVRKLGRASVDELASEAEKAGLAKGDVVKALIELHERGLISLEARPSI